MRPLIIIALHPGVQIGLQFFDSHIDLLSEGKRVKLILNSLLESLADAVGLGMLGLGLCVINVIEG